MTLQCNRCGECCKHGGECALRPWANLGAGFTGACELLSTSDECTVMKKHSLMLVNQFVGPVIGQCDFPHLKISGCIDGDYQ